MPTPRKELGNKGERLAAAFLIDSGHTIITTNLRLAGGEVDILARTPDGTLAVVEVKTRSSVVVVRPQANITPAKLHTLRRLAHAVADRHPQSNVQIDILEVDASTGKIIHTPNV